MATTKHFLKYKLKILNNLIKTFFESCSDNFIHIFNDFSQAVNSSYNIIPLNGQKFITFTDGIIFFDGANIHFSKFFYSIFDFSALFNSHTHTELFFLELNSFYI